MPPTRKGHRPASSSHNGTSNGRNDDKQSISLHRYVGGKPGESSISAPLINGRKRKNLSSMGNGKGRAYVGEKPTTSAPIPQSRRVSYVGEPPRKKRVVVVSDESDVEHRGYVGRPLKTASNVKKPRSMSSPSPPPETGTVATSTGGSEGRRTPVSDEAIEEENLVVYGESPQEEDSESDAVPVRLLRNLVVYEQTTKRLVPLEELRSAPLNRFCVTGLVSPYVDDSSTNDSDTEDGERQMVVLRKLTDFIVHWVQESSRFKLDQKIYVGTSSAWYILATPAEQYRDYFLPFWIKQRIFRELAECANRDPALTSEGLVESLDVDDEIDAMVEGGITMDHVKSSETIDYVRVAYAELAEERPGLCKRLERVPAVRYFISRPRSPRPVSPEATELGEEDEEDKQETETTPLSGIHGRSSSKGQPEDTVVMPRVAEICRPLYPLNGFLVVGEESSTRAILPPGLPRSKHVTFENDPKCIEWVASSRTAPKHYKSVIMDGTRFDVGDTVMVEPGEDEDAKRAAQQIESSNPFAKTKWFMKIWYMYEDVDGNKMFHGQYYYHSAACIPRQTAHPYGLFLSDTCASITLMAIYQKCNVYVLDPTEDEPIIEPADNVYFTGLYWDQRHTKIFERRKEEVEAALKVCKPGRPCVSCGIDKLDDERTAWKLLEDGSLQHLDTKYHIHDFVYIMPPGTETDVYTIAQIVDIHPGDDDSDPVVDVRLYERCDLIFRRETKNATDFGTKAMDERRLFRTDRFSDSISVLFIEGKAFVVHTSSMTSKALDDWCTHDDHFHTHDQAPTNKPSSSAEFSKLRTSSFKKCEKCFDARVAELEEEHKRMESHEPLRGLELFAGAGGLSTGFDQSGFVTTKWAVEMSASACMTYAANHPDAIVYNASVNQMLQHAVESFEGQKPEPLYTELRDKIPPMPKPGEVDFIYGGPPCQGFSRMNHNKTVDDFRNTLVCNMLSYVEFYRPRFFMLENVEGILHHQLAAAQTGKNKMEGGIQRGVVKMIMRVLTILGYQAHFKLLQGGQYGAPQSRLRVIFLGARRDLPLPDFPIPTHCTSNDVQKITLEHGVSLWPVVRCIPEQDTRQEWLQFAPLLRVSVEDAISDLPKFDWIDPHVTCPDEDDSHEVAAREAKGIKQFDALLRDRSAENPYAGYTEETAYASEPLSRYQKWMRRDMDDMEGVTYHYTARFKSTVVERVVNVPLKGDACHVDLPPELRSQSLFQANGKPKPEYLSFYGRINGKWHFATALTTAKPNNKGGKVLHPNQKRVLTIRELARAQGFPDCQQFLSTNTSFPHDDQMRQIGNAVPIPLALALGKAIGKVLLKIWKEEDERLAADRELSPDVAMDTD